MSERDSRDGQVCLRSTRIVRLLFCLVSLLGLLAGLGTMGEAGWNAHPANHRVVFALGVVEVGFFIYLGWRSAVGLKLIADERGLLFYGRFRTRRVSVDQVRAVTFGRKRAGWAPTGWVGSCSAAAASGSS